MRRNLAWRPIVLVLGLVLVGCGGSASVLWGQAQTSYNETAKALKLYRAPCVDTAAYANAGPAHPLCRIDDATWAVVYPLMLQADTCLKAADRQLQSGAEPAIADALACAEGALARLLIYRTAVREN